MALFLRAQCVAARPALRGFMAPLPRNKMFNSLDCRFRPMSVPQPCCLRRYHTVADMAEPVDLPGPVVMPAGVPEATRFRDIKALDPAFVDNLERRGITEMTPIQRLGIPSVLYRRDALLLQSETGSGKSLMYLVPVLSRLGASQVVENMRKNPGSLQTRAIILVPHRDLAVQLRREVRLLLDVTVEEVSKLVAIVVGGTEVHEHVQRLARDPPFLVVGTAPRVLDAAERMRGKKKFKHLEFLVLDEADQIIQPLNRYARYKEKLNRLKHPNPGVLLVNHLLHARRTLQLIFVSATMNSVLRSQLLREGWVSDTSVITPHTNSAIHLPDNVKHQYISTRDDAGRLGALLEVIDEMKVPTLVVLPPQTSIQRVVEHFQSRGVAAARLNMHVPDEEAADFAARFEKGDIQLVFATSENVRGVDFPFLEHVILSYVPNTTAEYIHVAGRVGRLGRPGTVTLVVSLGDKPRFIRLVRRLSLDTKAMHERGIEDLI